MRVPLTPFLLSTLVASAGFWSGYTRPPPAVEEPVPWPTGSRTFEEKSEVLSKAPGAPSVVAVDDSLERLRRLLHSDGSVRRSLELQLAMASMDAGELKQLWKLP